MSLRVTIDPNSAEMFRTYLNRSIRSDAKTIDTLKEFCLAKLCQSVMNKLDLVILRYKQADTYRPKSIEITQLELLALNNYFARYTLDPFLIPMEQKILEGIRFHYPQLLQALTNKIEWKDFISESSYAG